jgi:hypothetical protein
LVNTFPSLATIGDTHTDGWEGFMNCVTEMGSGVMIYIPSLIKIGSDVQRLLDGGDAHTDSRMIS